MRGGLEYLLEAWQEKRSHSAISTPESSGGRKDARVEGSPGSVSSTMASPEIRHWMSSVSSPAKHVEECKHQFNDVVRNDKICCSFCKALDNTACVSCLECNANACASCECLLRHAELTGKRSRSVTPPREDGGARKDRRVGHGDEVTFDLDEEEPRTQPEMDLLERDAIVREFKVQCEELTRGHLAAIKKLSDKVRSTLAIGGACLGDSEKKVLLKDALNQSEQAVGLLKVLKGNSVDALAPSSKRIGGVAFLDGVSIFVGGVPREADDGALLALFPRGAQIEERFRGGKGKYRLLKLSVYSKDTDQVVEKQEVFCERDLRVAKWNQHAPKSNAGRVAHVAQYNGRSKNKESAAWRRAKRTRRWC